MTHIYIYMDSCPIFNYFRVVRSRWKSFWREPCKKMRRWTIVTWRSSCFPRNSHGPKMLNIQSMLDGENMVIHAACRTLSSNEQKEMTLGWHWCLTLTSGKVRCFPVEIWSKNRGLGPESLNVKSFGKWWLGSDEKQGALAEHALVHSQRLGRYDDDVRILIFCLFVCWLTHFLPVVSQLGMRMKTWIPWLSYNTWFLLVQELFGAKIWSSRHAASPFPHGCGPSTWHTND